MAITKENGTKIYEGCVLTKEWERNTYHDSDFFTPVWDEETQTIRQIETGSTRHAGGCGVEVDATSEVIKKAEAYMREFLTNLLYEKNNRPTNGDRVRVENPRSKYHGVTGIVGPRHINKWGKTVVKLTQANWANAEVWNINPDWLVKVTPCTMEDAAVYAEGMLQTWGVYQIIISFNRDMDEFNKRAVRQTAG